MFCRYRIILLIFPLSFYALHRESKSESIISGFEVRRSSFDHLPGVQFREGIDIEMQELNPDAIIPLSNGENDELAERCDRAISELKVLRGRFSASPECQMIPISLCGKIKYYCLRTKRWVWEHKGKVTLIVIGGALCVYFGYYVAIRGVEKMTDVCDKARCKAEDVIDLVEDVEPLAKLAVSQCRQAATRCDQATEMLSLLLVMLKNGTLSIAQEALGVCNEMLESFGKATDFGYPPHS